MTLETIWCTNGELCGNNCMSNEDCVNERSTLSASVTRQSYQVRLNVRRWDKLLSLEDDDQPGDPIELTLNKQFNNALINIEYSGHFGSNIYFDLDQKDFYLLDNILNAIDHHLSM